jgi:hypothetical protein
MRSRTRRLTMLATVLSLTCWLGDCSKKEPVDPMESQADSAFAIAPVSPLAMQAFSTTQLNISIDRGGGYSGAVNFSALNVPVGFTVTFDSTGIRGTTATARVTVGPNVASTVYFFTIHASGAGATSHDVQVMVTVGNTPPYTMTAAPTTVTVVHGGSTSTTLVFARNTGFGDDIFLSAIVPTGITVDFTPGDVTGAGSVAAIHTAASMTAGNYSVTIHGIVTGFVDRTVTVAVTVQ